MLPLSAERCRAPYGIMSDFPLNRVGVFALSSAPDRVRHAAGIAALRACGMEVVDGTAGLVPCRRLAADDTERAAAFNRLANDPSLQALVAARGGYGVTRALPLLDYAALRRCQPWLIGSSDVSALLLAAWRCGSRRLIHGPMVGYGWNLDGTEAFTAERCALAAVLSSPHGTLPPWHGAAPLRAGRARGRLFPVNLTMLQCLAGTPWLPDLTEAILVLEDIHVPAHAVDRMLCHLRNAGLLSRLAGIVFGEFSEAEDGAELPQIIAEYSASLPVPSAWRLRFGHLHPGVPLPVGVQASLEIGGEGVRLTW